MSGGQWSLDRRTCCKTAAEVVLCEAAKSGAAEVQPRRPVRIMEGDRMERAQRGDSFPHLACPSPDGRTRTRTRTSLAACGVASRLFDGARLSAALEGRKYSTSYIQLFNGEMMLLMFLNRKEKGELGYAASAPESTDLSHGCDDDGSNAARHGQHERRKPDPRAAVRVGSA